jgi:peptidoglycan/xylan/chitin deacetylase (PgdA/CDA1 family)
MTPSPNDTVKGLSDLVPVRFGRAGMPERLRPRRARGIARHVILSSLAHLQRLRGETDRGLARPRVHFISLHSVTPADENGFRALLTQLALTHHFVGYSEAVERVRRGDIDRPLLTFSLDDGFKSCFASLRILEEFGARACVFVCSAVVNETRFDRVSAFCRDRLGVPPTQFVSWDDLDTILRAGHEVGSHARTHANLAALGPVELEDEIEGSRAELEARLGPVRHFAWPFGRFFHVRRRVIDALVRAGYESSASTERGCHVAAAGGSPAMLCLRRDYIDAAWPLPHCLYFLARSAAQASADAHLWPVDLAPQRNGL